MTQGPYPIHQFTVGNSQVPSADSSGFRILNMFNRDGWPTITESVVESADIVVHSVDSTVDSISDLARIGVWVWVFKGCFH